MAALGGEGGGAGPAGPEAGLPPEMAGLPPEMAGKMASAKSDKQIMGLMKAAKARQRSGKFQISSAKTAQQRRLRDEIKKCIAEIVA
jgi:predicted kinase